MCQSATTIGLKIEIDNEWEQSVSLKVRMKVVLDVSV